MDNLEDDLEIFATEEVKKINPKLIHDPLEDYHGEDRHLSGFEKLEKQEKGEWNSQ